MSHGFDGLSEPFFIGKKSRLIAELPEFCILNSKKTRRAAVFF